MESSIEEELEAHVQELIQKELNNVEKQEYKYIDKKTVTCKTCHTTEEWRSNSHFPNGCKKWRDSKGLICNGRLCGTCNRDRAGRTMKKMRSQEK